MQAGPEKGALSYLCISNGSSRGLIANSSPPQCDESRPACINCLTAKKECSYILTAGSQGPSNRDFILCKDPGDLARHRSPHPNIPSHTTSSSPQLLNHTPRAEPYVNLLHLELYQNLASDGFSITDDSSKDQWIATMLRVSLI